MRIRQWLRDAWDNVSMPTEEKRGDDDSVKDLLRLKIKPGRSKFVYFMLLLCFIALGIRIGWLQLGYGVPPEAGCDALPAHDRSARDARSDL